MKVSGGCGAPTLFHHRPARAQEGYNQASHETTELMQEYNGTDNDLIGPLGFDELIKHLPTAKFWLKVDPHCRIRKARTSTIKTLKAAPKKKVSIHSMLGTATLSLILLSCSFFWSPGINELGVFQLTNQFTTSFSMAEEKAMKITTLLTMLVAVTGQFRVPKSTHPARRLMFTYSTFMVLLGTASLLMSNIGGMPSHFFDAWSFVGRLIIGTPMICAFICAFLMIDDSIAGPDKGERTK